jgi:hypothetical protein
MKILKSCLKFSRLDLFLHAIFRVSILKIDVIYYVPIYINQFKTELITVHTTKNHKS